MSVLHMQVAKKLCLGYNGYCHNNLLPENQLEQYSRKNTPPKMVGFCYNRNMNDWEILIQKVKEWGRERNICNPTTQLLKCEEELNEVVSAYNHGKIYSQEMMDGLGDTLVTLIIFADILGLDLYRALELAYHEIKGRVGSTVDGNFIKSETAGIAD